MIGRELIAVDEKGDQIAHVERDPIDAQAFALALAPQSLTFGVRHRAPTPHAFKWSYGMHPRQDSHGGRDRKNSS